MIDKYLFTMSAIAQNQESPNEKSIEQLQLDTIEWDVLLQTCTEEIHFLEQFLSADIFQSEIPDLYERLNRFSEELEDIKMEKIDLQTTLPHHKNDLNGMRECEDINCDIFYHSQHQNLLKNIEDHLSKFQDLKLQVYKFSDHALLKNNLREDLV
jgi:chromosome segregation ATPase